MCITSIAYVIFCLERVKMNIVQFREELIPYINEMDQNAKVKKCDVTKTNGIKLCGICLQREGQTIFPTIYLESLFTEYEKGETYNTIAKKVLEIDGDAKNSAPDEFNEKFFLDYESVKGLLRAKLINTFKNKELLIDTPHKAFLDLSIVAYCDVSEICEMNASILIKDTHIKMWGVSAEDLIDDAIDNTRKRESTVRDIADVVNGNIHMSGCDAESVNNMKGMMYVVSNEDYMYGAVRMIYEDLIKGFLEKEGEGVFIIPSSIHEVLIIPNSKKVEPDTLNEMICDINSSVVSEEEILSNHAYYYSQGEGYLSV